MDATPNRIGNRGEHIFAARITQDFIFDVTFMGEKHEATDFCVEFSENDKKYMFFVQVKSTTIKPRSSKNLFIQKLSSTDVKTIVNYPYPTYLAGVEIATESVYIIGVFKKKQIKSIPKNHILSFHEKEKSKETLELLKQDVIACWNKLEPDAKAKTKYKTLLK